MKILLADDHDLYRAGLAHVLGEISCEVCEARNWRDACTLVEAHPELALAIVDLRMPGDDCFIELKRFLAQAQTIPVVVLSASENRIDMKRSLDAGAAGYIAKGEQTAVMISALKLVLAGGIYVPPSLVQTSAAQITEGAVLPHGLTQRQYDALALLTQGKSNREIANELGLSIVTVKAHVGAVFRALRVSSREEVIALLQQQECGIDAPIKPERA